MKRKKKKTSPLVHCKLLHSLTTSPFSFYTVGWSALRLRPDFRLFFAFNIVSIVECQQQSSVAAHEESFHVEKRNFPCRNAHVWGFQERSSSIRHGAYAKAFSDSALSSVFLPPRVLLFGNENSVNFNVPLMIFHQRAVSFFCRLPFCHFNEVLDREKYLFECGSRYN